MSRRNHIVVLLDISGSIKTIIQIYGQLLNQTIGNIHIDNLILFGVDNHSIVPSLKNVASVSSNIERPYFSITSDEQLFEVVDLRNNTHFTGAVKELLSYMSAYPEDTFKVSKILMSLCTVSWFFFLRF